MQSEWHTDLKKEQEMNYGKCSLHDSGGLQRCFLDEKHQYNSMS